MAGYVAYQKAAFDGATPAQRGFLKTLINNLGLGGGAVYEQANGTQWYVFADRRIDARFVENLAWANTVIASIDSAPVRGYATVETVQVEVPVRIQVEVPVLDENGDPTGETVLVWQDHPTDTQLVDVERPIDDRLKLAAEAQGATAWFTARTELPPGLTPVVEG